MVLILLVALVFYGVIPLWGAWRVRKAWNRFREAGIQALGSPEVDFSLLPSDQPLPTSPVRLTGTLEAFEGDDRLWIGNDRVSMAVSLRGAPVYFVDEVADPFAVGVEPPRRAEAGSLGALPEGTQFLVWGTLARDGRGQAHFANGAHQRLLVLAFEGSPATVLTRAVYAGRSPIDHWNSWTPFSVGVGFLLLLVLAYTDLRPGGDRHLGLGALALALLPATFFLPPGILFFYGFARLWSRARDQRARLDLTRMVTGRAGPERAAGRRQARRIELVAHGALGLALLANSLVLIFLLRLWVP